MGAIEKLFQVFLQHSFYANMTTKNLSVQPSEETSRLLRNNRIIFRESNVGFYVAGETGNNNKPGEDGTHKLKRKLPTGECLRFHVISKSSDFPSITNLPVTTDDPTVFRFSNRTGMVEDDSLLLHPSSFAGEETPAYPILKNGILRYSVPDQSDSGTASIRRDDGRIVLWQTAEPLNDSLDFQFDMTTFPADFYTLWLGNKPVKTYYHTGERIPGFLLGVVEIETGNRVAGTHRLFEEDDTMAKPDYYIRFEQRSTYWRYHIIFQTGTVIKNPVIVAGDYTFKKKENGVTTDDYLIFESEQMIPLREQGIGNISLKRQTGAAHHMVLDNLPNPGTRFAEPDPIDENKYYSDIFVYL